MTTTADEPSYKIVIDNKVLHSPGSKGARLEGCICPVMDNCNGMGFVMNEETVYCYNGDCKYHRATSS